MSVGAAPPAARTVARLALLVLGLVAAGLLLRALGATPGTDWVDRYVRDQGLVGETVFVLGAAAATAVGLPRQAVAFLAGYAFGAAEGLILAMTGQMLGCALAYGWARAVGGAFVERRLAGRFGPKLRPLVGVLRESTFSSTLALRLFPAGSNLALNLLAGMAGAAALPFLAATLLGYLPQTLVFALLGKGIRVDGAWQLGLSAALLACSIALGLWIMRRHRAGRAVEPG
jgi:uncharacterized membrane protein YdjX (TVP38/TMEM64 family)